MSTATANDSHSSPSNALPIALWVVQGLLAFAFGMAGVMATTMPISELAANLVWPGALPPALVRFIGGAEFLGALGMILPSVTRIRPQLTPLAGAGLATIQTLAIGFHVLRGEFSALPINLTLGLLAAFVAWGRFKKAPIPAR